MLPEKKMTGSHRGYAGYPRETCETSEMGETVDGSRFEVSLTSNPELRTPDRSFLAHLGLHAPRSVALVEFLNILLGGGRRRCPEERVHESVAVKIL